MQGGAGLIVNEVSALWAQSKVVFDTRLMPRMLDPLVYAEQGEAVFWLGWLVLLLFTIAVTDRTASEPNMKARNIAQA